MSFTAKDFEDGMMLYGTDIDLWPDALQADALCMMSDPTINAMIIRHQYFEEVLLNNDVIAPMSANFTQRVLRAAQALDAVRDFSVMQWLGALFADFRLPQPAYMAVVIAALGLGIGLGVSSNTDIIQQASLVDDGVTL